MIKPTVGRMVWFYVDKVTQYDAGHQPLAAIVSYVWSDNCVNLAVFDIQGRPISKQHTSIHLVQDGETIPAEGPFCCWMPYQIGQAKKTEQAEALADAANRGFQS